MDRTMEKQLDFWSQGSLFARNDKALVVMSGGQDSTTCLGVARHHHAEVEAVAFNYGQKHEIELVAAKEICEKLEVPISFIEIPALASMKSSALVNHGDVSKEHSYLSGLPASFVPCRNAMFLTIAWGLAMEKGIKHIYTGVCQTDFSGYPDCRYEFIDALESALTVGYQTKIEIHTPLMFLDKAHTFMLAERCGILETVLKDSHTCYNGVRDISHDWGKGCGECPACVLRKKGYNDYLAKK